MWKRIVCEEWNFDLPSGRQVTRLKQIKADFFNNPFLALPVVLLVLIAVFLYKSKMLIPLTSG